jgi:hypothetical protein
VRFKLFFSYCFCYLLLMKRSLQLIYHNIAIQETKQNNKKLNMNWKKIKSSFFHFMIRVIIQLSNFRKRIQVQHTTHKVSFNLSLSYIRLIVALSDCRPTKCLNWIFYFASSRIRLIYIREIVSWRENCSRRNCRWRRRINSLSSSNRINIYFLSLWTWQKNMRHKYYSAIDLKVAFTWLSHYS